MVKTTSNKVVEIFYGHNWRLDVMSTVKGVYIDVYVVSGNTSRYDSTIDEYNIIESVLLAIKYVQSKVKNKELVINYNPDTFKEVRSSGKKGDNGDSDRQILL